MTITEALRDYHQRQRLLQQARDNYFKWLVAATLSERTEMNKLVERARRIVRNYPEHVARREQAKLILELVDEIQRLEDDREAVLAWCEDNGLLKVMTQILQTAAMRSDTSGQKETQ